MNTNIYMTHTNIYTNTNIYEYIYTYMSMKIHVWYIWTYIWIRISVWYIRRFIRIRISINMPYIHTPAKRVQLKCRVSTTVRQPPLQQFTPIEIRTSSHTYVRIYTCKISSVEMPRFRDGSATSSSKYLASPAIWAGWSKYKSPKSYPMYTLQNVYVYVYVLCIFITLICLFCAYVSCIICIDIYIYICICMCIYVYVL